MENRKIDRRIRKTKQQLRRGLTELLKTKSVKDISVRELADLADINRGTFYLHYRDVFDMVDKIEEEMLEDFNHIIDENKLEENNLSPLPVLKDMFAYIADNADMCIVLLGRNGDISFIDRLKKTLRTKCLYQWIRIFDNTSGENFEYFFSFILSGCIGLLTEWLERGMKESPKDMAQLAEKMIVNGVSVLKI